VLHLTNFELHPNFEKNEEGVKRIMALGESTGFGYEARVENQMSFFHSLGFYLLAMSGVIRKRRRTG
jgi:hypothetical protein